MYTNSLIIVRRLKARYSSSTPGIKQTNKQAETTGTLKRQNINKKTKNNTKTQVREN